jgi:hypothetical protein
VFNAPMSEDEFVALVTEGQPPAPGYFVFDAVVNRKQHPQELVPRQATFALFSNAVRSRAFWGTPLPSSTIQVV